MINYRALILSGFILLLFVAIVMKLYSIQIAGSEYYALIASKQQYKPQTVKAERGTIRDARGEVLSYTNEEISFFVDTRMMTPQKIDTISTLFAKTFNKKKSFYKSIIENGARNVCLEKKVPMDKAIILKKKIIEGYFFEEDFSRIYPHGSLAAHVLGYVNKDLEGVEGIEKVYDDKLTGRNGNYVFERDVLGRTVSFSDKQSSNAVPGKNVELTLIRSYQKVLQEELRAGLEKYGGESAIGIIMNPNSGEILALANIPDFDPANYEMFNNEERRDRALTDTFEPGSTIKSLILSILFDQKSISENDLIDTENGRYMVKNVKVLDTHPNQILTVREVLEKSSNVGMVKISSRIPDETLYKYLRDFGFGNKTAIELPSEAEGILRKPSTYNQISKAFLSFGYGLSVTPLQMISAYGALVNGGTLYKPFIVKSIHDSNGNLIEKNEPQKIRNVINKSTSDLIKNLMIGVVEKGTGTAAQLENVLVGGKTGTSQKLENGSYTSSKHNSSFVGFLPAENPQFICMIHINSPEVGKYGGLVAAPIFKNVAKRILENDLNLAPERKKIKRENQLIDELIADLKTSPAATSKSYLNVAANTNKPQQRRVITTNGNLMPDLVKQSLRDALAQLNQLGIEYKVEGNGKVISQSIEPGAAITRDSVCYIKCEPSKKINTIRIN